MSKQPIIDPLHIPATQEIISNWMNFYNESQEPMWRYLKEIYPKKDDEDEKVYDKAIKARTFDIMRGFLPAGITTQLSWHTNLRQAWDKLSWMTHHPLDEAREIAENILTILKAKYPNSFGFNKIEEQENYREYVSQCYNYYAPENASTKLTCNSDIKVSELNQYKTIIQDRPLKTGLPSFLADLGKVTFEFLLDFGSFRDLQRHRNGVCRMPLLTSKFGFNEWYLQQLPANLRFKAETLIEQQTNAVNALPTSDETKQYFLALGFNCPCKVTYGLPAAVYVTELRSGKAVHPTLRKIAHQMANSLSENFPMLKMHIDFGNDDWDVRRGLQDIVEK